MPYLVEYTDTFGGVYTFVYGATDQPTHIAASTLLRALERKGWPVTRCMIAAGLAEALERGDLGVEAPHALRLARESHD